MDPDSSSLVFTKAKETVDDSIQNKEEDSPKNKEGSSTSPLIESEWVKELSQINPLEPINTSASEEVIDADPISYKLPNEEKRRVYEPKMSTLKEQILTDLPETITPKDKAWINKTDTLNKKNESRSKKSIPKRRKRTLSLQEKYSADWDCIPKPREDGGRVDYFYYLKKDKSVMCRSLKAVENYEMTGNHEGRKGKQKKKEGTEEVVKEERVLRGSDYAEISKAARDLDQVLEHFLSRLKSYNPPSNPGP